MLDKKQLQHLADLAKIELSDEELKKLLKDLNEILDYVSKVEKIDLNGVDPMIGGPAFSAAAAGLPLREDRYDRNDEREEVALRIIKNFPQTEDNFLKVPKIIDR
ncbi:MAG: Asp-tRNA(Asn)/Glu-tRNA(Gln) amidotransferase subunit GatC [Patescibacteria group bacterium]|nr:Asp-tRNA(Asn)/Glu-tRNA(Gln) amidotransferase subunit GatC [Patescibacteria group bacterium]